MTARTYCRIRIATWNVNTLYQAEKFDNLKREAERMKLDVVGVSEVRWTGSGHVTRRAGHFITQVETDMKLEGGFC